MKNQVHTGSGDNVNNKYEYIIKNVQTGSLKNVLDNIMHDICYRHIQIAIEKLNVLKEIDSLDGDVKSLLNVIGLKIELSKGSTLSDKRELLSLFRNQSLSVDVRDVVTSILIDFESRSDPSIARTRYEKVNNNNAYVKEVFFERIATIKEIQKQFQGTAKNDLLDQELAGLIRGSLRVEEFELAVDISHFLNNSFPSTNSKALLTYSQSCFIVTQTQKNHYLTLSKKIKDGIDLLIVQLINYFEINDLRYIAALTNLLNITFFLEPKLIELGIKCIEKIREVDKKSADTLQKISFIVPAPASRFELTSASLNLEGLMNLHSSIEGGLIQLSCVNSWLDNGGDIQTGDDYLDAFAQLHLKSTICSYNDRQGILSLEDKAKEFIELDKVKYLTLNPYAVIRLCDKFTDLGLPLQAIQYLSYFISDESWVSPLFESYIRALIASEKYELFISQTKHLLSEDKTFMVWINEAQLYERTGEYDLSIKATREAIQIEPNNPYAWNLLLNVSRLKNVPLKSLQELVFEIPEDVFLTYNESKLPLVNTIATFVDLNIADKVLVDWFVKSPDVVAVSISQIHFNSLINRPKITENPYTPNHCRDGVKYTDGFDTFNHLLVTGIETNHASLLDASSPKGKILSRLKVGETVDDPIIGEITLIERLPPYIAAFRLAIELRNKGNDGTDVFKLLTMPNNKEEFIPYLEKALKRFSKGEKAQNSALNNPNMPLVVKSHYTDRGSPVKGAINHLTLKDSTQHLKLFNEGIVKPTKAIVDIHTAIYFSLMGLVTSIKKAALEIVLSQQTKLSLELWIKDTLREDYFTLDLTDQGIQKITSEDIKRNSLEFIEELKELIEYSRVETLNPSDTPDEFIQIRDVIDETVYSTLQLSVANNIPLLCIDHIMCILFHNSVHPVVNIYSTIRELLNISSLKDKKKGIQLNLLRGTPIEIFYSDIINLSRSTDNMDVYCVAKFIKKYGVPTETTEVSLNFLLEIAGQVIGNAYINGEILKGGRGENPSYDGYAEHVFNSCCAVAIKVLFGESAERRLAIFIFGLLTKFSVARGCSSLIMKLTSDFARGYFLDIQEINRAFAEYNFVEEI